MTNKKMTFMDILPKSQRKKPLTLYKGFLLDPNKSNEPESLRINTDRDRWAFSVEDAVKLAIYDDAQANGLDFNEISSKYLGQCIAIVTVTIDKVFFDDPLLDEIPDNTIHPVMDALEEYTRKLEGVGIPFIEIATSGNREYKFDAIVDSVPFIESYTVVPGITSNDLFQFKDLTISKRIISFRNKD